MLRSMTAWPSQTSTFPTRGAGAEPGSNPWIIVSHPRPAARLRLFCFPYAGGKAALFHSWPESLPHAVEVCAVQLPGRGGRLAERPYTRLQPLVQTLAQVLYAYLDKPFAFFGHSMGGIISFELARELRQQYSLTPAHLFISARHAAHLPNTDPDVYKLPEDELVRKLRGLQGTPSAVLDNPELMQLTLPLLRADFELCGTYSYIDGPALDCPITVFGGDQDQLVDAAELEAWRYHTADQFKLQMFSGDHFFIGSAQTAVLHALATDLKPHL